MEQAKKLLTLPRRKIPGGIFTSAENIEIRLHKISPPRLTRTVSGIGAPALKII
jgi:hypothetical protein